MNYNTNKNNFKKSINYYNNNSSNSFTFKNNKKTDEELSKSIFIHILRINFFNFLKNVKESNQRKLLLVNTYFFSYKTFISSIYF